MAPTSENILLNLITRHFASVRLANHGTGDVPKWKINEQVLINTAGHLLWRVAKGPVEPFRLTSQQQQEVQVRLKMGEPHDNIVRSYGVDVATIRRMAG